MSDYTATAATNQAAMQQACNQCDADEATEQQDEAQLNKDLANPPANPDDVSYILTILVDCLDVYGDKAAVTTDTQNVAAAGLSFESSINQEIASGAAGDANPYDPNNPDDTAESQDLINNMYYFYSDLEGTGGVDMSMINGADKASMESNLDNIAAQLWVAGGGPSEPYAITPQTLAYDGQWAAGLVHTGLVAFTDTPASGGTINPQFSSAQDSTQALESTLGTENQIATTDYQSWVSMCNEVESVAGDFISDNQSSMQYFTNKQVTN